MIAIRQRSACRAAAVATLIAFSVLLLLGGGNGTAEGAQDKRFCGIPPGDGAYSYVKAWGVSCRVAKRVSRKAGRKFCGKVYQRCDEPPGGGYDRGRVKAKGWRCEMKVGWEFYRAKCERKDKRFVAKSAA